jgi:hypothetical protein
MMSNDQMTTWITSSGAPHFTKEPTDVAGDVGSDIRVECRADGNPPPKIEWSRYGIRNKGFSRGTKQSLYLNPNILSIAQLTMKDAGDYVCKAENSVDTITRRITLTVRRVEKDKRSRGLPQNMTSVIEHDLN